MKFAKELERDLVPGEFVASCQDPANLPQLPSSWPMSATLDTLYAS
jgi:hypothetical protein